MDKMENWIKNKPSKNPWLRPQQRVNPVRGVPLRRVIKRATRNQDYYGKPVRQFKDSDKDGVSNVFDCSPRNRRKQDVISPSNFGGGMMDMYRRQESGRQNRAYQRELQNIRRLEEERIKQAEKELQELSRIQGETKYSHSTVYFAVPSGGSSSGSSSGSQMDKIIKKANTGATMDKIIKEANAKAKSDMAKRAMASRKSAGAWLKKTASKSRR